MFEITPFAHTTRYADVYDPFKAIDDLEKSFFGHQASLPKTDIRETENAYILDAELPGFDREDIHAEVKDGYLTIHAEHSTSSEDSGEKKNYIRRERTYGSYTRSFNLDGINSDSISASYKDGILTVTLPKTETLPQEGRKLDIQ